MNSLNLKIIKDYIDKKSENAPPGKSAYDVAVDNGFVGTEEQWLNSLIGEQGVAGADWAPTAAEKTAIAVEAAGLMDAPSEIYIGNGAPSGEETIWIDTASSSPSADGYILTPKDKVDIANIVLQELPTTQGVLYGNTSN